MSNIGPTFSHWLEIVGFSVFTAPMLEPDASSLLPLVVTLVLSLTTRNVIAGLFRRCLYLHCGGYQFRESNQRAFHGDRAYHPRGVDSGYAYLAAVSSHSIDHL